MIIRSWAIGMLVLLVACSSALGAPTQATVRVEGSSTTLLEETAVTTDTRTVPVGECGGSTVTREIPGPTALGILHDAAAIGGFAQDNSSFGPGPGDLFVCAVGADIGSSTAFWLYKVNNRDPGVGGGVAALAPGDRVLWYFTSNFMARTLDLSGPARAASGSSITVAVNAYDAAGVPEPGSGATVAATGPGGIAGLQSAGPDGGATFSFTSPGLYSLKADRAGDIRSNAVKVCVSDTGTGDCGVPPAQLGSPSRGPAVKDSRAPTAKVSGPRDGQRFVRGPRLLSGTASDDTGVTDVRLAFRRHLRGHCGWWSGKREKFVGANCHKKFFFSIGHDASWSYLLPRALGPGRYVLDVKAFDRARNRDERFVRGTNRVVFYVGSWHRTRAASAARARAAAVQVMVAGKSFRRVGVERAGARSVRAGRRSCAVGAGTPLAALAALLGHGGPNYSLRDYGHCSRTRPADASQLFVRKIGPERNHGNDGWFYKVNDRAPEIGGADLSGRRLRQGDRVLWFYCVFDDKAASCQRSLRTTSHGGATPGKPFEVRVLAFDNRGDSAPLAGATVSLGAATAMSGSDGVATLMPTGAGVQELNASKPGSVPAFPLEIRVR